MPNKNAICEGVFIGQALASDLDPAVYLALNVHRSVMKNKGFNGPDILSKHLLHYATEGSEVGYVVKQVYERALKRSKTERGEDQFVFNQSTINEITKEVDDNLGGKTAGCSPAQRCFPLALNPMIKTSDLFEVTVKEAALTHHNVIAGQAAGIINLIIRYLIEQNDWYASIDAAFTQPGLHADIVSVKMRYNRWSTLTKANEPAYAPAALVAALHFCSRHSNALGAIQEAQKNEKIYCASITGILAGARWGISIDDFKDFTHKDQLAEIRRAATELGELWKLEDQPKA